MKKILKKRKVLRLVNSNRVTSAPFNQFTIPKIEDEDITILTFNESEVESNSRIKIYAAKNSVITYISKIGKLLKQNKYHFLHSHTTHTAFFYFLSKFFISNSHIPFAIITVHCSYTNLRIIHKLMLFISSLAFDKIVFCSHASKESFPKLWLNFIGGKGVVIQNGVSVKRIKNNLMGFKKKFQKNIFKIIYTGRLIKIKNVELVIDVVNSIDNTVATIIGDGSLKNELEEKVRYLGLSDRITFLGEVSREVVYQNLANSDLFISLSLREGLPITPLEAILCRCSVLLSNIPPHQEIAHNCEFISLVDCENIQNINNKVSMLMNSSRKEIIERLEKSFNHVEDNFNLDKMLKNYDKLLKNN